MHRRHVQGLGSDVVHAWCHKIPFRIYVGITDVESLVSQASRECQHGIFTWDRFGLGAPDLDVTSIGAKRSNRPVFGSTAASARDQTKHEHQGENGPASHQLTPFSSGVF